LSRANHGINYFIFDSYVNFILDSYVNLDKHVKEAACKDTETINELSI
jgi:hypothetical protein